MFQTTLLSPDLQLPESFAHDAKSIIKEPAW